MSQVAPNEYEEARRRRMQRNQQMLQDLGLLQHPLSVAGEQAARRRAPLQRRQQQSAADCEQQQQAEPPRKSRRLLREEVENSGMSMGAGAGVRQERPSRPPQRVHVDHGMLDASCDSDPGLDAHNIMRVRSMSDRALQTRIWKIQRVDKLQSFIKVLDCCGKEELAAEARDALRAMTGGEEGL